MDLRRSHLFSRRIMNDRQLVNPIRHLPSQSSSDGEFFRNASGCDFNQSTFTVVRQNVYHGEQPSLWNKYGWPDFDQKTLRYLRPNSTNIVTMEMEPMTSTSRVQIYRIHCYRDSEDIFYDHLGFVQSSLARQQNISQFLGTSIDNADGDKFIVLSGGGSPLLDVFRGSPADLKTIKMAYCFQLMDIFSTVPFTVSHWSWSNFWTLPLFSRDYRLLVDVILLESRGLLTSSKLNRKTAYRQSGMVNFHVKLQDQTLPGDMERILDLRQDLALVQEANERRQEAGTQLFNNFGDNWADGDDCWGGNNGFDWWASNNSMSKIEELDDDAMSVDSEDFSSL